MERFFDLGKENTVQEPVDFIPPCVHDPVNTEIQVGLVQLKQFGKFGLQLFKRCHICLNPVSFFQVKRIQM